MKTLREFIGEAKKDDPNVGHHGFSGHDYEHASKHYDKHVVAAAMKHGVLHHANHVHDLSTSHGAQIDHLHRVGDHEARRVARAAREAKASRSKAESAAPVDSGQRVIHAIDPKSDHEKKMKEYVSAHNKQHKGDNPQGKTHPSLNMRLNPRPANKDHDAPHKKMWLDGHPKHIAAFKKHFGLK